MKFLILTLAALGDTLFTTPSLKALRNSYPGAEITVIAWEDSKDILVGNKNIDHLITCRSKGQLLTELQELRDIEFDVAIGLSTVGSYISYLVNSRKKLGFKGEELDWIYDYNVPDNREIHAVDYCLEIVRLIGARPDLNPKLEIAFNHEHRQQMEEKLFKAGVNFNRPVLAIHPGGKYFSYKRWPEKKFGELIKQLDNMYNLEIVLIGGKEDQKLAKKIIDPFYDYNQTPVDLTGKLKIKETAAFLSKADLFIGNDSAPIHLASAAGIPVIALIGPTNPVNFHPYGTDYRIVKADLGCAPCFSWLGELKQYLPEYLPEWISRCKASCMQDIFVNDVISVVKDFVNAGKVPLEQFEETYAETVNMGNAKLS